MTTTSIRISCRELARLPIKDTTGELPGIQGLGAAVNLLKIASSRLGVHGLHP
jgi:hypothetical protein